MTARETAAVETAVRIVLEWGTCPGHDNVVVVVHVVWCMWWAILVFKRWDITVRKNGEAFLF
jgi:hypothetical protein